MQAVILTNQGKGAKLVYSEVKAPVTKSNEALVKVLFCGINHLDILIMQGKRPGPAQYPHILGSEIVGVIETLGSKNNQFKAGDTVAVYPWTFCGKCNPCKTGHEQICDNGGTFGRTRWGGYAQYVVTPVENLVRLPKTMRLDHACAITLAGTTAVHLVQRAQITNGATVLVTGATGGLGTLVIQLLKSKKCTVICTTSHPAKKSSLEKLEIDYIVSSNKLISKIKNLYPDGVEYAIDIMGGNIWSQVVQILAKNGTMVFCATTLEGDGIINIGSAFSRQISIIGSYGGTVKDLKAVLKLLEKKTLRPQIDSIYSVEDASEALKKLQNQHVFGKILLSFKAL